MVVPYCMHSDSLIWCRSWYKETTWPFPVKISNQWKPPMFEKPLPPYLSFTVRCDRLSSTHAQITVLNTLTHARKWFPQISDSPFAHDCSLAGPGEEEIAVWFYDAETMKCTAFTYGGEEGNANRWHKCKEHFSVWLNTRKQKHMNVARNISMRIATDFCFSFFTPRRIRSRRCSICFSLTLRWTKATKSFHL